MREQMKSSKEEKTRKHIKVLLAEMISTGQLQIVSGQLVLYGGEI